LSYKRGPETGEIVDSKVDEIQLLIAADLSQLVKMLIYFHSLMVNYGKNYQSFFGEDN
jgi:endonuclease III-like uncharacterized protein